MYKGMNTKFRFYQNEEITALGNLKVGSRFLDNYFDMVGRKDWEGLVVCFNRFPENPYVNIFTDVAFKRHQPMHDLFENKDSRKVFLVYRNPIKRYQSAFSQFFTKWLIEDNDIELLPFSIDTKKYLLEHKKTNTLYRDNEIPNEILEDLIPEMEKFVSYWTLNKIGDQHTSNYLHILNEITNKVDSDKLNLVNIDEQKLEKVFNIDKLEIDFKSNSVFKDKFERFIMENTILQNLLSSEMFHFNNLEKIRNG